MLLMLTRQFVRLAVCLVLLAQPALADRRLEDLLQSATEFANANKPLDAVRVTRQALAHAERVYGPNHPEVAHVLERLAQLYRAQNRIAEARPLEDRSRAIRAATAMAKNGAKTQAKPSPQSQPQPQSQPRAVEFARPRAPEPAPGGGSPGAPVIAAVPPPIVGAAPPPSPPAPAAAPSTSTATSRSRSIAAPPAAAPAPVVAATQQLDPKAYAEVPVFFGTNRAQGATQTRNGVSLASFTSNTASALTLGKAVVSVPRQGREKGEIPRPRSESFWRAKEAEDPRFHFMLLSVVPGTREVFIREVNERLLRSSGAFKDQAFVFVHGFNVPFEDAVYRTAQIAYDLDFTGAPFLYSWPTLEGTFGYVGARDRAMASRAFLRQFLDIVSKETKATRIHLVAHSMGTWPLLDVLREIAVSDAATQREPRFQEVVLAAPDMDRDNFVALAQQICPDRTGSRCAGGSAKGLTIYATNNDRALLASVRLAAGIDRAGLFDEKRPFIVKNVDTIDVSAADTSFFSYNHSQPLEREQLLKDIGLLLGGGLRPPHQRYPVYEARKTTEGSEYWRYLQKQ